MVCGPFRSISLADSRSRGKFFYVFSETILYLLVCGPCYSSAPISLKNKQINDIATLPSVLLRSCLAGSKRISQCRILGPPSTRSRAAQAFVTVFVTL